MAFAPPTGCCGCRDTTGRRRGGGGAGSVATQAGGVVLIGAGSGDKSVVRARLRLDVVFLAGALLQSLVALSVSLALSRVRVVSSSVGVRSGRKSLYLTRMAAVEDVDLTVIS
jgi:hypothetical protein